ncbi:hypothetical protein NIES4101_66210 [Calothrix sp. NIES-4101]|nr:hypothetical protein NIES4101_66210 [Calothrix sp. NIES-4101]
MSNCYCKMPSKLLTFFLNSLKYKCEQKQIAHEQIPKDNLSNSQEKPNDYFRFKPFGNC